MKKSLSKYVIVLLMILTAFFLILISNLKSINIAQASQIVVDYDLSQGEVIIKSGTELNTSQLLKSDNTIIQDNVPIDAIYNFVGDVKKVVYDAKDGILGYITIKIACNIKLNQININLANSVDLNGIHIDIDRGTVNLIIADNTKNTIVLNSNLANSNNSNTGKAGIYVKRGSSLSIVGEQEKTGELTVKGAGGYASADKSEGGGGAGIGGNGAVASGNETTFGNIEIKNTTVITTGGDAISNYGGGGAGIGSGGEVQDSVSNSTGKIVITNSTVNSTGGESKFGDAGAGIGNGGSGGWSSTAEQYIYEPEKSDITIENSAVTAKSGSAVFKYLGADYTKNFAVSANNLKLLSNATLIANSGDNISASDKSACGNSYGVYAKTMSLAIPSRVEGNAGESSNKYAFYIEDISTLTDYQLSDVKCGLSESDIDVNKTFRMKVNGVANGDPIAKLSISKELLEQSALKIGNIPSNLIYGNEYNLGITGGNGDGAISYMSSNTNVATVDDNGFIKIVSIGEFKIIASKAGDATYKPIILETAIYPTEKRSISIEELIADDKVYDGNDIINLNSGILTGVVDGDDVLIIMPKSAKAIDVNAGENKSVILPLDIVLTGNSSQLYNLVIPNITVNINKKTVKIEKYGAINKTYDGTVDVQLNNDMFISGFLASDLDKITQSIPTMGKVSDKNVGQKKIVTVTGSFFTGSGASNYELTQQEIYVNINKKTVSIEKYGAINKTYDGTVDVQLNNDMFISGFLPSDLDKITQSIPTMGKVSDKNVGQKKIVTVTGSFFTGSGASNYELTQQEIYVNIDKKSLMVTGFSAKDRVYDLTTIVILQSGKLNGIVNGDVVNCSFPTIGNMLTKDVGVEKVVSYDDLILTGEDVDNYIIEKPKVVVNIFRKEISVVDMFANSRPFDKDNFEVMLSGGRLDSVFDGDDVYADFPKLGLLDKNTVGEQKVDYQLALEGNDKFNYNLIQSALYVYITKVIAEIIETENGYYIDSKYTEGKTYATLEEAKQASKEAQSKDTTEKNVKSYVEESFVGLPDNVSSINFEKKYMDKLDTIKKTTDGYIFNGKTYSNIENALDAVELVVKIEIFEEKSVELKEMLGNLDRTCGGGSIIKNEINRCAVEIDDLDFSKSDSLAKVYNSAFTKVLFAQKLQQSVNLLNNTMEEKIKGKLYTQVSLDKLYAIFLKNAEVLKVATENQQIEEVMQEWEVALSQLMLLTVQAEQDNANSVSNGNGLPTNTVFEVKNIKSEELEKEILDSIKGNEIVIVDDGKNKIMKSIKKSAIKYVFESDLFFGANTESSSNQIVGDSTVTIKLPDTKTGKNYSVLLKTADGKLVYKNCTVIDGVLTFNTNEFGTIVVLAVEPVKLVYAIIPVIIIILLVVLYFALPKLLRKKEGV